MAMEALHGIPARDPTAYRPFLEFCVSIPDDQYLRNGSKRWLARRLLQNRLPDMVLSERRRGRQAADWHLRLGREREELIAEIDRLAEDPAMQERMNLAALRGALADWEPTTPQDTGKSHRLELALSRGLATARFIHSVEGRN
ncbi:asparagine synthase-related protein [Novosphingobium sp. TH158]|uniref:asparagine synthase-related protein n=1 Tax=Novosphingobium sp. TH158 TaxID=2067455 RepID=UPI001C2008D9|nr:asparagine synthase-related protein [Novosphingobium sp. TH158]